MALPGSEQYVLDGIENQLRTEYPELDLDFANFANYAGPALMPAAEELAKRPATSPAGRAYGTQPPVSLFVLRLATLFLTGVLLASGVLIAWSASEASGCPVPARSQADLNYTRAGQADVAPAACAMKPPKWRAGR